MQNRAKYEISSTYPHMATDAYDLWSVGLIMVDEMCNERRREIVSNDVLALKRKQWQILKEGLAQDMDYDIFFCGADDHKQGVVGFWPIICNIKCDEFYADKRLVGIGELINSALQRDPQTRNLFQKEQDSQYLMAKKVPKTTYYVPMKHLTEEAPGKFRVKDDSGNRKGVFLRATKDIDARTRFGKHYDTMITGRDLGDGWMETKESTPQLGVETLMPMFCSHQTYILETGKEVVVSDGEDFEHDFAGCVF